MLSSTTTGSEESNYNSSSWSSTQATPRRTMEEVWKDISLASLSNHNAAPNRLNNNPHFRNMALQDFLAQPFGNVVSPAPDHHHHHPTLTSSPNPNPDPAATTVLSLNHLGSDQFQFFCIENLNNRPNTRSVSDHSFSGASPFEALGSHSSPSSGLVMPPAFGADNMRFPEFDHRNFGGGGGGGGGGDRRHKRMIKNRESAARSRARKQAYTNELELEVQHLMEENARLRRQQEQLTNAAASQLPKKNNLRRSSTAPF